MFTGIIESTGKVASIKKEKDNLVIEIESSFSGELKLGQSVAHNGVCLTVESKGKKHFSVTAVKETLEKTNLGSLKKGSIVNLERALKVGDRLDGHFVQGHVDTTAVCKEIKQAKGSWIFKFKVNGQKSKANNLIVDKGSICINGVSLTVVEAKQNYFSVAIIPHTFSHTNFKFTKVGTVANIEFDVLAKHIVKFLAARGK